MTVLPCRRAGHIPKAMQPQQGQPPALRGEGPLAEPLGNSDIPVHQCSSCQCPAGTGGCQGWAILCHHSHCWAWDLCTVLMAKHTPKITPHLERLLLAPPRAGPGVQGPTTPWRSSCLLEHSSGKGCVSVSALLMPKGDSAMAGVGPRPVGSPHQPQDIQQHQEGAGTGLER